MAREALAIMHKVIPIHDAQGAAAFEALRVTTPQLDGDDRLLLPLIAAVADEVAGEGGPLQGLRDVGCWLRAFRLRCGEAEMRLAPELGPYGDTVAARAFDVLRRHLHDTDVFVVIDPPPAPGVAGR